MIDVHLILLVRNFCVNRMSIFWVNFTWNFFERPTFIAGLCRFTGSLSTWNNSPKLVSPERNSLTKRSSSPNDVPKIYIKVFRSPCELYNMRRVDIFSSFLVLLWRFTNSLRLSLEQAFFSFFIDMFHVFSLAYLPGTRILRHPPPPDDVIFGKLAFRENVWVIGK